MPRQPARIDSAIRVLATRLTLACALLFAARVCYGQEAAGEAPAPADKPAAPAAATEESVEIPVPLIERTPFDKITLDAANQGLEIETVLLELPDRKVPSPLPTSGSLELRRLSHPSIPYTVQWSSITKVELFEDMLLAEADRLTAAGKFSEAFNYLAFLAANYPQLPGLERALQAHLWREASTAYAEKRYEEAWPALVALYERNSDYPRLVNAVQAVSDDLINQRLQAHDYAAARLLVDALGRSFPQLQLTNIARWHTKFITDATEQLTRAQKAFAQQDYSEARDAVNFARSIMPEIAGGAELWKQIQETAPEIRVGVTQAATGSVMSQTPTWAVARVSGLVNPRLVEMVDFGAEGGVYASPWADVKPSDDGLHTTITLTPAALNRGLYPGKLALGMAEMAEAGNSRQQSDFAALINRVNLVNGRDVELGWRRPHVRPEAFLQIPLRWLGSVQQSPGLWFEPQPAKRNGMEWPYQRTGTPADAAGEPRLVVETLFEDDQAALDALFRGDVDAIDRVPPWQLNQVRNSRDVVVVPYRLPTVHVLIPNPANPLLELREFRRALNYGIDANGIVRDIILGGEQQTGFRTLSGPFPAGVALNDPGGYAYNQELLPRPYEPRLAALLAAVARTTLTKRAADKQKAEEAAKAELAKAEGKKPEAAKEPSPPADTPPAPAPAEEKAVPPTPLVLAHGTDPVAKLACQAIKMQLDLIGIPVTLKAFSGAAPPQDLQYDLLYVELAVWEPVYDARRLLSSNGVAGRATAMMSAALDQLDRAENWSQARDQLREIHRISHYDLPMIPLWQTVNYFAHRKALTQVGDAPVTLYQNLPQWRKALE
ncbi:ABC transporter substrate-binding protein [Lacipirellula sp.]|uniref:ABC transporter substrate-binding protein n=1 Tax=Lacipirellula sp. TaxID=2691419 RepID=UPI003D12B6D7